jgi:DNA-binding NtrC family response regulator
MTAMARVLVVDDEPAVRFTIAEALTGGGFDVVAVASAAEALAKVAGMGRLAAVDAVVSDLVMPGEDGLALAARLRDLDGELPVILLTARGSEAIAVAAMKAGVHDYLTKPFAIDELRVVVARACEARRLRRASRDLALGRALGPGSVPAIAGDSPAWRALMDQVAKVGPRDVTVLVQGETGTGKELIAAALHAASPRRTGPFVRFNCGAIPADLAEAELFGHARGAFTGATSDRRGFFAQADGGTLVLDEVGELPLALQPGLLRALQNGEIQRVGAGRIERVDVRVIACTNRDLRADIAAGRFRADLFYRLAVVDLQVPPLRDRPGDIPALIDVLCARLGHRWGMQAPQFSPALVAALAARDWPGNVRELENALARLVALGAGRADPATGGVIFDVDALAAAGLTAPPVGTSNAAAVAVSAVPASAPLRAQIDAFERQLLAQALQECAGNQSEVARRLGVTRTTLLDKLKRHGLHRPA